MLAHAKIVEFDFELNLKILIFFFLSVMIRLNDQNKFLFLNFFFFFCNNKLNMEMATVYFRLFLARAYTTFQEARQ